MDILEIIIIVLLVILIGIVIVSLFKGKGSSGISKEELLESNYELEKRILDDNNRVKGSISKIQNDTNQDLSKFKSELNQEMENRFNNISKTLNDGLLKITADMNKQVKDNFESTNKTFIDIREKIEKLDAAQQNLLKVESSVNSFKEVLVNNKARGNFGEFQLNAILKDIFGDQEGKIYFIQKQMSNGTKADSMLSLPDPLGNIVIDSKFPYENYKNYIQPGISETDKESFKKLFVSDVKAKVDEIATKYIIKNETADQAIMFIPSEAVFAEVQGNYPMIVEYARKKNVWLTSPTTLMALLETIQLSLRDMERSKNVKKILEELGALSEDFRRYAERWESLDKHLDTVVKDAREIKTTSDKITRKFDVINKKSLPDEIEEIETEE